MNNKTILIWRFEDAPPEFQKLAEPLRFGHDWVAFIPYELEKTYIPWIHHQNSSFGRYKKEDFKVDGGAVYIGAN